MSEPHTPPPPPPLWQRTGYAAYEPTNWAGGGLRRIRGLSIASVVLCGLAAIAAIVMLVSINGTRDAAEQYLAEQLTPSEFDEELAAYGLGGLLALAARIGLAVVSIVWLYRLLANHRTLNRRTFWAPLWAVFGWFLPPFLFVIPLLILLEAWKAAHPGSPAGTDTAGLGGAQQAWRRSSQPVAVWIWFALFGVAQSAAAFLTGSPFDQFSRERDDVAERFVDHGGGLAAQSAVELLSAAAWAVVVWSLTKRHMALTGESARR